MDATEMCSLTHSGLSLGAITGVQQERLLYTIYQGAQNEDEFVKPQLRLLIVENHLRISHDGWRMRKRWRVLIL